MAVRTAPAILLLRADIVMEGDTERSGRVHPQPTWVQLEGDWQPVNGMGLWPRYLPHMVRRFTRPGG